MNTRLGGPLGGFGDRTLPCIEKALVKLKEEYEQDMNLLFENILENIILLHHHVTIGNLTINHIGKKIRIKSRE